MPTETELKLNIPATAIDAFKQHPLLQACADTCQQQHLIGTYYDTPELELKQAKVGLRVRREGDRWIQTMKSAGSSVGGLHQRHEWEAEVIENKIDFSCLPKIVQDSIVADPVLRQRIEPVFTSDFHRTTWQLTTEHDDLIEVCLDQGEVYQGDQRTPICEVELELKQGSSSSLLRLALEFLEELPLTVENASKAQRGYALSHPQSIKAISAAPPVLDTQMSAEEAIMTLLSHYLMHLQANEAAVFDDDTSSSGLQQLCLAVHHLQTCFALCRKWLPAHNTEHLLAELTWLENTFDHAHAWDVFNDILEAIELEVGQQADLRELAVTVTQHAMQAHESIATILHESRYTRFLLQLQIWLLESGWKQKVSSEIQEKWHMPLLTFARKRLSKQHKRLKAWPEQWAELKLEEQQTFWLDCNRAQTLLSFFSSLFQKNKHTRHKQQSYVDWLDQLREKLSSQHEALSTRNLFEPAALDFEHPGCHFLQGWYAAKHSLKKGTLEQTWNTFRKQKPFWKE